MQRIENSNSKGHIKGTNDSKNWRCETLYFDNYESGSISSFAVLDLKLWLEADDNLHTDRPFAFIQIHLMEVLKLIESVAIF